MNVECIICGDEFSHKRARLGYKTCLNCGEKSALAEKHIKSKCIAPLYNKSAYQYITPGNNLKSMGRKI